MTHTQTDCSIQTGAYGEVGYRTIRKPGQDPEYFLSGCDHNQKTLMRWGLDRNQVEHLARTMLASIGRFGDD
jgi:hypothetical protein